MLFIPAKKIFIRKPVCSTLVASKLAINMTQMIEHCSSIPWECSSLLLWSLDKIRLKAMNDPHKMDLGNDWPDKHSDRHGFRHRMTKADPITRVRSSSRAFVETFLMLMCPGSVSLRSLLSLPDWKRDLAQKAERQAVCVMPSVQGFLAVMDNKKCLWMEFAVLCLAAG